MSEEKKPGFFMRVWTGTLDLLFPPKCVFCNEILDDPRALMCPDCQQTLPWLEGEKAERHVEFVSLCVSPLRYQNRVRDSIRRYKFSGRKWYCKTYGLLTAQCVQDHLEGKYDLISWVPVSRKRRKKRGYDQAFLMCEEMCRRLGTEPVSILKKVRNNPAQSGLTDHAARRANVMGVYELPAPEKVQGKRVLLVDDVVTTGETLSECARMLRTAGAEDVVCVTLAKAGVERTVRSGTETGENMP